MPMALSTYVAVFCPPTGGREAVVGGIGSVSPPSCPPAPAPAPALIRQQS